LFPVYSYPRGPCGRRGVGNGGRLGALGKGVSLPPCAAFRIVNERVVFVPFYNINIAPAFDILCQRIWNKNVIFIADNQCVVLADSMWNFLLKIPLGIRPLAQQKSRLEAAFFWNIFVRTRYKTFKNSATTVIEPSSASSKTMGWKAGLSGESVMRLCCQPVAVTVFWLS
jgi:hypothetical protein